MTGQMLREELSPAHASGTSSHGRSGRPARTGLVCILLPDLRGGGAERLHVNLANDWVARGLDVQFAVMCNRGDLHGAMDPGIGVHDLRVSRLRSLLFPLARYLRRTQPSVTLAAMWPLTCVAIAAWRLAGRPGRLVVSDHSQLSISAVREMNVPRWLLRQTMRHTYPHATGVIAVSNGVKQDLCAIAGLDPAIVRVIYNPTAVGIPNARGDADARIRLWGRDGGNNILSVGTLKRQKDHATLIDAFARLPAGLDARLTILGEGHLRPDLEKQIRSLDLGDRVRLPGFVLDPYPWYQTADLFVLSSRWEGFGNVLVEALECGVPVVSTDCQSGPAEILDGGRFGRLVPVQDPAAMAAAMCSSFAGKHDTGLLRRRAQDFSVAAISDEYLHYLDLKPSITEETPNV
ncbi:MAG TPA: glycosyltransferase [Ramlibacter sp.]|uniref:glycosyltransferase n=1 Tax=Ramlibacter sp. TaxID=1917967 RepID=UPI002ED6A86D